MCNILEIGITTFNKHKLDMNMTVNTCQCVVKIVNKRKDDYTVIPSLHISIIFFHYLNGKVVIYLTDGVKLKDLAHTHYFPGYLQCSFIFF